MSELFGQLGINLPMLLAQAVNFGVLLVVLTIFVYKPLLRAMEERKNKIEIGVRGAELIEAKLNEADLAKEGKLREADKTALRIIGQAEQKAGERGQEIVSAAHGKGEAILAEAKLVAERKKAEELEKLSREAGVLVREAIAKAIAINPEDVDKKLIDQASVIISQRKS